MTNEEFKTLEQKLKRLVSETANSSNTLQCNGDYWIVTIGVQNYKKSCSSIEEALQFLIETIEKNRIPKEVKDNNRPGSRKPYTIK